MPSDKSWNIKMVRAREALAELPRLAGTDDEIDWRGIEVAHLDTGYTAHSVFGPWTGDNSGVLLTADGMNYVDSETLPKDHLNYSGHPGHGTRTCSVLCGNLPGMMVGVAPGLPVVPYRVTNNVVIMSATTRKKMEAAIRHAVQVKSCEVISISLGTPLLFGGRPLGEAVDFAYERGILVVAAGGQVTDRVTYPGRFERSIGVGGVKPNREVWWQYHHDEEGDSDLKYIDAWAPADEVFRANSIISGGQVVEGPYGEGDGTSYATVHVAAAAAMWLACRQDEIDETYSEPWQRVEAFRRLIGSTSQKVEGESPVRDGTGILDIKALLSADLPAPGDLTKVAQLAADQFP